MLVASTFAKKKLQMMSHIGNAAGSCVCVCIIQNILYISMRALNTILMFCIHIVFYCRYTGSRCAARLLTKDGAIIENKGLHSHAPDPRLRVKNDLSSKLKTLE